MLNRLAPAAHGLGILIQSLLHGFENVLMLPSRDAAFFACGALILECAGLAGVRPVAAHLLPVFLVGIVEFELLASGAAIEILLRHIDEVLRAKAAFRLGARRHRCGQRLADASARAGEDGLGIEVAAV